jgi:hypothetical protein
MRLVAVLPAGPSAAGLVDAEHPDRLRFGQLRLGMGDEGPMRGRPRHSVGRGDLEYGPACIPLRDRAGSGYSSDLGSTL